ncbi:MAG: hypothetical protein H6579_09380 [Chitinophagales bacterium]|nr:hypothetical protein [Chitinophagales bacterium]
MSLIFQYPLWFIFFCLALGAIYSLALYYKSSHFVEDGPQFLWIKRGLALLRFLSVSLLSFLLLSPLIKSNFVEKIEPVIVFVHDNSASIPLHWNTEDSSNYIQSTNQMLEELAKSYQIDYFTFDQDIRAIDTLNFEGKASNLSKALEEINGLYYNRNVGAVIFASDGIYNEGNNPIYNEFNFPLYTIGLGDTSQHSDAKIVQVLSNKIAYLDDKVQVEVKLLASQLKGKNYKIHFGSVNKGVFSEISSQSLEITKDFDEQNTSFTFKAKSIGIQKYRVYVESFPNEISLENNAYDFFVEVIDNRQKILLLADGPHPDIAAIKSVIDLNKSFELEVQYANRFNAQIDAYSLVILHQIPSKNNASAAAIAQIEKSKIPVWYITGSSSNYANFSNIQKLVNVSSSGDKSNDAAAYLNKDFASFQLSEATSQKLKKFPPLLVPFGSFNLGIGTKALLKQKIGAVESDYPLLAFQENLSNRSAVLLGDGLWRWRLYDFQENNSNQAFQEIIEKTLNYLALKGDKRKFRVSTNKNIFYEGEEILFEAELYNDNYELINEPNADLIISDEEGKNYPFAFSKTEKAYLFKTKSLPIGSYNYVASTNYNGKQLEAKGAFSVSENKLEGLYTQADHLLLKQLAQHTNGQFFPSSQVNELAKLLLAKEDIKATLYQSFKTRPIINLFGLFFLILALLSIEWFARKYFGSY